MTGPGRIESVDLSLAFLPLATPISDAKVLTGRQQPLTRVAFLFARVRTADGAEGLGFSHSNGRARRRCASAGSSRRTT